MSKRDKKLTENPHADAVERILEGIAAYDDHVMEYHANLERVSRNLEDIVPVSDALAEFVAAGKSTAKHAKPRTWRDVQKALDTIRANREPFTTFGKLAARLGCSAALVHKAIDPKPDHLQALTLDDRRTVRATAKRLKAWQVAGKPNKAARRESDLNEAALARLTAEAAPDADAIMDDGGATWQRLLNEATEDERAQLHTLDDIEQRQLVTLTLEQDADRRRGRKARPR